MSLKLGVTGLLVGLVLAILSGCNSSTSDQNTLRVGTIAGPETELMETAKQVAQHDYGLVIKIVPFTDYEMPNSALAAGSIDANVFQHQAYLDLSVKKLGYKIVAVGKTFIYPMGIYSKKIKHLDQLDTKAIVAIPNDPSNEARALLLLEKFALIGLNHETDGNVSVADIISNPKHLRFREVDAEQLPRLLSDVDIAVINTNYAMLAGLLPSRDAITIESSNSPYANLVVVRQAQVNDPRILHLVAALHSAAVQAAAKQLFAGQAIPAWK